MKKNRNSVLILSSKKNNSESKGNSVKNMKKNTSIVSNKVSSIRIKINNLKKKIIEEKNKKILFIEKKKLKKVTKFDTTLNNLRTIITKMKNVIHDKKIEKKFINKLLLSRDDLNGKKEYSNFVKNENIIDEQDCQELNIESFHSTMKRKLVNKKQKDFFLDDEFVEKREFLKKDKKLDILINFKEDQDIISSQEKFFIFKDNILIKKEENRKSEKKNKVNTIDLYKIENFDNQKKEMEKSENYYSEKIDFHDLKLKLKSIEKSISENLNDYSEKELTELKQKIENRLNVQQNHQNIPTFRNFQTFRNFKSLKNSNLLQEEKLNNHFEIMNKSREDYSKIFMNLKSITEQENKNFP